MLTDLTMDSVNNLAMELLPRQTNSCPSGFLWYVCSGKYVYQGCCANDPCTDGYCVVPATSSSVVPAPSSSAPGTSSSTIIVTTTVTSTIPPSSSSELPSSSFSLSSLAPAVGPPVSTSAPPPPPTSSSSSISSDSTTLSTSSTSSTRPTSTATAAPVHSGPSNKGAIAGGVVGGVAALAACLFLFWICWRRRKQREHSDNANLHRSVSSTSLEEAKNIPPMKPSPNTPGNDVYFLDGKDSLRSLPNRTSSTAGSHTNTIISRPDSWNPSIQGLTNGPSEASTYTSMTTTNMDPLPETNELPGSIPQRAGFTPELPDTGVHQVRAELASDNQSELINVQRQRRVPTVLRPGYQSPQSRASYRSWDASPSPPVVLRGSPQPSPSPSPSSGEVVTTGTASPVLMSRQLARQVVTTDGVVLGANLDRYDATRGKGGNTDENMEEGEMGKTGRRNGQGHGHIMSFMSYENYENHDQAVDASGHETKGGNGPHAVDGNSQEKVDEAGGGNAQGVEGENVSPPKIDVTPA